MRDGLRPLSAAELRILLETAIAQRRSEPACQRLRWFLHFAECGSVSETCRRFGIARMTFYRWIERFDPQDLASLEERSHEPHSIRQADVSDDAVELIRQYRMQSPQSGKERVAELLAAEHGIVLSVSTVGRIIERECLYFGDTPRHWRKRMAQSRQRPVFARVAPAEQPVVECALRPAAMRECAADCPICRLKSFNWSLLRSAALVTSIVFNLALASLIVFTAMLEGQPTNAAPATILPGFEGAAETSLLPPAESGVRAVTQRRSLAQASFANRYLLPTARFLLGIEIASAATGIYRPINYQGKLTNSGGVAISNGVYDLRFRLYDAASGGVPLWSETWSSATQKVTSTGGLFSIALGTHTAMTGSVNFNSDSLFLQVEFDPGADGVFEEVFTPRRRFASVPYAHNANTLDGLDSTQFIRSDISYTSSGTITVSPRDTAKTGIDILSTAASANVAALKISTQGANHITFGTGGTNYDTNLYRAAANLLKTDDSFSVVGTLSGSLITQNGAGNNYFMGNVGIGTTSPGAQLQVSAGAATTIGQIIKGVLSQSADLQQWQNSAGAVLAHIDSAGRLSLNRGSAPNGTAIISFAASDNFSTASTIYAINGKTINSGLGDILGIWNQSESRGAGTVNNVVGIRGGVVANGGSTVITSGKALEASLPSVIAGTITNTYGLYVNNQGASGVTNAYGLYVAPQSGAASNYAAVFAGGNVGIGTVTPKSTLDVGGTISGKTLTISGNGSFSGSLAVKRGISGATLEVLGTASGLNLFATQSVTGTHLYAASTFGGAGLADCDTSGTSKLLWDSSTKQFSCGTDQTGGSAGTASFSGAVLGLGDARYVRKAGDTMTGALNIGLTFGFLGLNVRQTASGKIVYAAKTLASSGNLVVKNGSAFASIDTGAFSGSLTLGHSRTISLTRRLPATANDAIDIGTFACGTGWACSYRISVVVTQPSFSIAKEYVFTDAYAIAPAFQRALPISSTGPYGGHDFDLDVRSNGTNTALRLRRTSGFGNPTAYVTVQVMGPTTFTASTTVASVSAPDHNFITTGLTQKAGLVGIGMADPTYGLTVSGAVLFNSAGYNNNVVMKGVTDATLFVMNAASNAIGIGTSAPTAKLEVQGTISGSTLHVLGTASGQNLFATRSISGANIYAATTFGGAGLADCDTAATSKLLWDAATKQFSCGTDQTGGGSNFGSGDVLAIGDARYVKKQGDTMTGALTIDLTSGYLGLKIIQTASGNIIHAEKNLSSSGTLVVVGTGSFKGNLLVGDASADTVTVQSNRWTFLNDTNFVLGGGVNGLSIDTTTFSVDAANDRIGIGTTAPETTLEVIGTMSGRRLSIVTAETPLGTGAVFVDQRGNGTGVLIQSAATTSPVLALDGFRQGTGAALAPHILFGYRGTFDTRLYRMTGSVLMTNASLLPETTNLYDLGSNTYRWRDLYLSGGTIAMGQNGDQGTIKYNTTTDGFGFDAGADANVELTILASGRVGIGTATPKSTLDVAGTISGKTLTVSGNGSFSGSLRVARAISGAALEVLGTASGQNLFAARSISGTHLYAASTFGGAGLASCSNGTTSKLLYNSATKQFSCGTDQNTTTAPEVGTASFSGATLRLADARYVRKAGDTMTGALTINLTSGTIGLRVLGGMSGNTLTISKGIHAAGSGVVISSSGQTVFNRLNRNVDFVIRSQANNNLLYADASTSRVGIGTASPETALEVLGTASGQNLFATSSVTGSHLFAATTFGGAGLADCDTAGTSKLLWDATTKRFSCGTDQNSNWSGTGALQTAFDARYVNTSGDTMTGALLIRKTSGTNTGVILNVDSGGLVYHASTKRVGIGTSSPQEMLHLYGANRDSQIFFQTRTIGEGGGTVGPGNPGTIANDASVGTSAWGNVSSAGTQNDAYADNALDSDGEITQYLKTTNFGFNIPSGATIQGITVEVDKYNTGGSTTISDYRARIVKGGSIGSTDKSNGSAWPSSDTDTYTTYGGSSDLWGETWSVTDINASDFGFAFAATASCGLCGGSMPPENTFIDHVRISVAYSTSTQVSGDWLVGSDFDNLGAFVIAQTGAVRRSILTANSGGLVGIGTGANLNAMTTIYTDDSLNKPALLIRSRETTASQDMLRIVTDYSTTNNVVYRVTASGATYADGPFNSAGADYAERFLSSTHDLQPGEAVCLDPLQANTVKRCDRSGDPNVMGIVSTRPAFVGDKYFAADADGLTEQESAIVGLIGQLPAKAVIENDEPINVGDALAAAGLPGFVRRARAGESTVGVALSSLASGEGTIDVLITRRNQSDLVEKIENEVTQRIADMHIEDDVLQMVQSAMAGANINGTVAAAVNAQVQNLNLAAQINGIINQRLADGSLDISAGGSLGADVYAAMLTQSGSSAVQNAVAARLGLSRTGTSAILAQADLNVDGALVVAKDLDVGGTLHAAAIRGPVRFDGPILPGADFAIGAISLTGSAVQIGSLTERGALTVIGDVTIDGLAVFLGAVEVRGELIVSANQAGFAVIPARARSVTVTFGTGFVSTPVVNATPNGRVGSEWWLDWQSQTGFVIRTDKSVGADVGFSWTALGVRDARTAAGRAGEGPTIPFHVDAQGRPFSLTDTLWNSCIADPYSFDVCRGYHQDSQWFFHPDIVQADQEVLSFTYDPAAGPSSLIVPDSYEPTVVEAPVSSSAASEQSSSSTSEPPPVSSADSSQPAVDPEPAAESGASLSADPASSESSVPADDSQPETKEQPSDGLAASEPSQPIKDVPPAEEADPAEQPVE